MSFNFIQKSPNKGHGSTLTNSTAAMVLGALGVVFGDIGTSPLYALKECFHGTHGIAVSPATVMGVLSLIFWTLAWCISIKYISFVLRADNKGEGGILSLLALASPVQLRDQQWFLVVVGLFGAALLYGDGVITPAISVLSAVEGVNVATNIFEPYVDQITIVVLIGLFWMQKKGTNKIGFIFGPIMVVWFVVLGLLGFRGIMEYPSILNALNPIYAFDFFVQFKMEAFMILSMVFLVLTGGEALYADMGHFGRKPIQLAWFFVVLPGLILNYFGQGAIILADPSTVSNPFYHLTPDWALYPTVLLATTSTVIASQALISGVFSLTSQAIQLGYSPRSQIIHTSSNTKGQIYMPNVNWMLLLCTVWVVLWFKSSSSLAAAYGLSVSFTMVITTFLLYFVAKNVWNWSLTSTLILIGMFFVVDLTFFAANLTKVLDGGWLPLAFGAIVFTLMTTWHGGRKILAKRLRSSTPALKDFISYATTHVAARVPGTAVFMVGDPQTTPPALVHNFKHNKVLHEKILILTITTKDQPYVPENERVKIEKFDETFFKIIGCYGFMDFPNIPELLDHCKECGVQIQLSEIAFFLGRETLIPSNHPGMAIWREKLFAIMAHNAQRATYFFNLPNDQVIEVGMQVEI